MDPALFLRASGNWGFQVKLLNINPLIFKEENMRGTNRDQWTANVLLEEERGKLQEAKDHLRKLITFCCSSRRYEARNPHTIVEIEEAVKWLEKEGK